MFEHCSSFSESFRQAGVHGWARGAAAPGRDVSPAGWAGSSPGQTRRAAVNRIARLHALFMPIGSRRLSLAPVRLTARAAFMYHIVRPAGAPWALAALLRVHPRNNGSGQPDLGRHAAAGGWNFVSRAGNHILAPGGMSVARAGVFMMAPPALTGLAAGGLAPSAARGRSFAPPMVSARATHGRAMRAEVSPVLRDQGDESGLPARRSMAVGSDVPAARRAQPMAVAGQGAGLDGEKVAHAPPQSLDIGQALESYFFRQSRLPPSGAAAFDPRITPAWTGLGLV